MSVPLPAGRSMSASKLQMEIKTLVEQGLDKRNIDPPVLLDNDASQVELRKKIELLKGRYQHAVKTELINFCYASSHATMDDGLIPPESSNRSPDFIQTLMNIVGKDKKIAEIAVNMVEQIDLMEKAKLGYSTKRGKEKDEEAALKEIWENHKRSRKEIAKLLDEEQTELYPDKTYNFKAPELIEEPEYDDDFEEEQEQEMDAEDCGEEEHGEDNDILLNEIFDTTDKNSEKMEEQLLCLNNIPSSFEPPAEKEKEEEESDTIIRRGMQKIMCQLGCDSGFDTGDLSTSLSIVRDKLLSLKKDIQTLKSLNTSNTL